MDKFCRNCRAFCMTEWNGTEVTECRQHPQSVPVLATYWCLEWQAKEKSRGRQTVMDVAIDEFALFWDEFPKRIGKKAAQKAFQNAQDRPRIDDLLEAIRKQKRSPQWLKDNGQFIPHPATWLNRGQWADVATETKPSVFQEFLARGAEHDESTGVFAGLDVVNGATVGEDVSERECESPEL